MGNWFIGVGLFLCAAAMGGLVYRHETSVVVPAPKVELSCPAVDAPIINVPKQDAPVVNVEAPKSTATPAIKSEPKPARKTKKRSSAAATLPKEWSNVRR